MSKLCEVTVGISADTTQFKAAIERATKALENFKRAVEEVNDTKISVSIDTSDTSGGNSTLAILRRGAKRVTCSHCSSPRIIRSRISAPNAPLMCLDCGWQGTTVPAHVFPPECLAAVGK